MTETDRRASKPAAMHGYCGEREKNPNAFRGIPPGYCGFCDCCGKPGHMCAHPHLPTTGAWCDDCWQDLLAGRSFGLHQLIWYLLLGLSTTAGLLYWILQFLK